MAKELPYFQFEPAEYLTKDVSFCSLSAQGLFINICSFYWQRQCELSKDQFLRRFNYETEFNELIKEGVIDVVDGIIKVKFLDLQYIKATDFSKEQSRKGSLGGRPKKPNESQTKAELKPNESRIKAIREDKRREEDIINNSFLSEIKISDDEKFISVNDLKMEIDSSYLEQLKITQAFQKLFIKNLKEKNSPTSQQEKVKLGSAINPIRLMIEKKEATKAQITEAYKYLSSPEGEFWKANILSTSKLREKLPTLLAKKNTKSEVDAKKEASVPNPSKRKRF